MSKVHNTTGTSLRDQAECLFDKDFYYISLQLIKKAYPELHEYMIYPDNHDFEDHRIFDPCGRTYEAKNQGIGNFLINQVNKLAEIGIFLIDIKELNTVIFIPNTGDDLYESYYIPLYRDVFHWI